MTLETHNLNRKLSGLLCKTYVPCWSDDADMPPSIEYLEKAAETLDHFIDLLEDGRIGVQRTLVPSDEVHDWNSPRKMIAPANETSFRLSVCPAGGLDLFIGFEDKNFREHGLSFEETGMLVRSFAILRMSKEADPAALM